MQTNRFIWVGVLWLVGGCGGAEIDPPPTGPGETAKGTCASTQLQCGDNGLCEDVGGSPHCVCRLGYSGETCGDCAAGYQDNDLDGLCAPDCSGMTCSGGSTCSDESGTAMCTCAAGYSMISGTCEWTGVIADPGFQNTPQSWLLSDGATVDPTFENEALVDSGALTLDEQFCSVPSARQAISTPPLEVSGPLALKLNGGVSCWSCPRELEVEFADTRATVVLPETWGEAKLCFGERHMAASGDLTLMSKTPWCTAQLLRLDRAEIVPDASCPMPGAVFNGDFESEEGWVASSAEAGIFELVGMNGSRGVRIREVATRPASITGWMSIPDRPHQAIEFSTRGNADALRVQFGEVKVTRILPANAWATHRVCVVDGLRGHSVPIRFTAENLYGYSGNSEWFVDDVRIVEDTTCPAPSGVPNAGFELSAAANAWNFSGGYGPGWEFLVDPASAHSGATSLHGWAEGPCGGVYFANTVSVPKPQGNAGPAIRYWIKGSGTHLVAGLDIGLRARAPAEWTQRTDCLDTRLSGRTIQIQLNIDGGGGLCAEGFPREHVWFDDFEVITTTECPVE